MVMPVSCLIYTIIVKISTGKKTRRFAAENQLTKKEKAEEC